MGYQKSLAHQFLKSPDARKIRVRELWKLSREKRERMAAAANNIGSTPNAATEPPKAHAASDNTSNANPPPESGSGNSRNYLLFFIFCVLAAILIAAIYKGLKDDPQSGSLMKPDGTIDIDRFFQSPSVKTAKKVGKWITALLAVAAVLWALSHVINQVKNLEKKVMG